MAQSPANVCWIGGSPCSGKSSIAAMLSAQFHLNYYKCDDHADAHGKRANADQHPVLSQLLRMTWEDIWMRPVAEQITTELAYYREEFGMIVDDLVALPSDRPILAEGAALLPEMVAPLLPDANHAIWIVPTPEFQLHHYRQRPWIHDILKHTSDPEQAFQNWMARDIGYAEHIAEMARGLGFVVITVDGTATINENAAVVRQHFRLS